jgi:hypothetical protein
MKEFGEFIVTFLILSALVAGWIGYNVSTSVEPTAMDVYRGRTTLEITYKDSVAIDSVVVFKDKEEQL